MSSEGGTPDSTPERTRRGHTRLAVVSVAAVLLAGGGGAYWAATAGGGDGAPAGAHGGGSPSPSASPPPLALDGYGRGGPSQGIAVGEPDPHGSHYRAAGKLPQGPRSAPVYLPKDEVGRDEVALLAKALDVQGTPRLDGDTWRVGGAPGAGEPVLQVARKGPGLWSYTRYGGPESGCVRPPGTGPQRGKADAPVPSDGPPGLNCPLHPADPAAAQPVSEERAKAVAAPVFTALGLDGAQVDAGKLYGAVRVVTADPVHGGLPSHGWQTSLRVGADGQLVGGSGRLQAPAKGAEYPLISADEALKQLNGSPGGGMASPGGGCASAVPYGEGEGLPADGGAKPCPLVPSPSDGPVTVRGASFALAQNWVRGRPALVPSWLFTAEVPGTDRTVTLVRPAVDPKFLVGPSQPGRSPAPTDTAHPVPTGVESYSRAEGGQKLLLRFWGGMCTSYAASAEQSAGAVTVKILGTARQPERPCVMMARQYELPVRLDQPLDGRRVLDAVDGRTVPESRA
ncbi:hypothetical protein ACFP1Z_31215 [Streptomyces gamaensis]|uniref:Large membrane protein n=1 Tax=Streptomyces gamaensis TaxID=1763542 RepID=A0ABW0Z8B7_9ACTN